MQFLNLDDGFIKRLA